MAQKPYYMVSSLARGIKIIELLVNNESMTVSEVALALDIHRTVSHRFLATLQELGYVQKDGQSRYRLSFRLFEMGMKTSNAFDIRQISRSFMQELARISTETVNLGQLDGLEVIIIDKIVSREVIRSDLMIGARLPLNATAQGKIFLAFLPQEESKELIDRLTFQAFTPNTITNSSKLISELEEIRSNGFAINNEELDPGVRAISAPIFSHEGRIKFTISIAGFARSMTDEKLSMLKKPIMKAAHEMSQLQKPK